MANKDERTQDDLNMDDGTEGSTTGYLKPGEMESAEFDDKPDEKEDEVDEEEDEDLDEDDEEESDDDEEEPDELETQRRELERDYTKKYRELSKKRGMIQMMERIQSDPERMIPWLADQLGVTLSGGPPKDNKTDLELNIPDLSNLQPGQDESMPAFINRAVGEAIKGITKQLPQFIAEGVKQGIPQGRKPAPNIFGEDDDPVEEALKVLDEKYEDWPLYEDNMIEVLKEKPKLINDPDKLYEEGKKKSGLFTKRKVAKAKKTKRISSGIRPSGKRKTSRKNKIMNFGDAWERAKVDASRRK